jgi:hypothetical protein
VIGNSNTASTDEVHLIQQAGVTNGLPTDMVNSDSGLNRSDSDSGLNRSDSDSGLNRSDGLNGLNTNELNALQFGGHIDGGENLPQELEFIVNQD